MRRRELTLVLFVVLVTCTACTAPTAGGPRASSTDAAHPTAAPSSAALSSPLHASASTGPTTVGGGRLLFLRIGSQTSADGIVAVSSATGHVVSRLPVGVANAAWSVLYSTVTAADRTTVTAYDPRSGTVLRTTSLTGSFALPVVVPGDLPGGLTSDGRTLVMVDRAPQPGSSRFALLDTSLASPPRFVTLPGDFAFDAISPDARFLYLIEHLGQAGSGHYQVRAYDSALGELVEGVIVDKRELGEAMEGRPVARATSSDGQWVYTLYIRDDGTAFVHQLDTTNEVALCADLPEQATARTPADAEAWRLALSGTSLPYAANSRLGILIALGSGEVRATGHLPGAGATGGGNVDIAVADQALYVAGPEGLTTVSTGALVAVGQALPTAPLASVVVSSDGRSLYGLAPDGIVQVGITGSSVASSTTVPFIYNAGRSSVPIRLVAVADSNSAASAQPTASPPGSSKDACAVTRPIPTFTPPAPYPVSVPDAYGSAWFGSADLWVMLDRDGEVWDARSLPQDNGFGNKTFWWSTAWSAMDEPSPAIAVIGTRLDGPGGFVVVGGTNATADFGTAMLVGVDIPTTGCWQLTGRYRGAELSYVVSLRDQ